jgi:signal peptidase II
LAGRLGPRKGSVPLGLCMLDARTTTCGASGNFLRAGACGHPAVNGAAAVPASRYAIFVLVTVAGCALDLITKQLVFAWRGLPRPDNEWWLWEPYIGIETAINTGALFGMGSGWGRLFALLSIAAAIGIPCWLFLYRAASSAWLTVSLSCIMGGILGNLYDRLGLWIEPGMPQEWQSGVRDWILLRYGRFTWPNFNVADSLLVCGAAMFFCQASFEKPASVPGHTKGA